MKLTRTILLAPLALVATTAHASSLPQMDPTWYPNQLLWLALSFIALYITVARFIAPAIQSVLTTRENAISEAIREAERAKHAAESTRGNVESASNDARHRAAEILAQAQAENSRDATEAAAKLERELARKADNAAALLDEAVKKAATGIDAAVNDLARAMTAKLLAGNVTQPVSDEPKLKLAKR